MTVLIFLGSLLGAMALGIPIAYSLLLSGVALMWHLDLFDAQILAQNVINGADSFPLLAVPFFMLAGEIMNVGGLSKRIVNLADKENAKGESVSGVLRDLSSTSLDLDMNQVQQEYHALEDKNTQKRKSFLSKLLKR